MNIRELAEAIHTVRISDCRWPAEHELAGVVERLGNGSFGCAYLLPDGRVLKVGEGIDATCVWINEAAMHFAKHGQPGRCMPVVWEYETALAEHKKTQRVMRKADGWTRMPDGSLVEVAAEYEFVEIPTMKAWWYAVMEKVTVMGEGYHDGEQMDSDDDEFICAWGRERGITNTDIAPKNWGRAADGRAVCFDPFYHEPPADTLKAMRTVQTGYTGPRAYTATPMETPRKESRSAMSGIFDAELRRQTYVVWALYSQSKLNSTQGEAHADRQEGSQVRPEEAAEGSGTAGGEARRPPRSVQREAQGREPVQPGRACEADRMIGRRISFVTEGGTVVDRGTVLAEDSYLRLPLQVEYHTNAGDKRIERFHPAEFKGGMHVE